MGFGGHEFVAPEPAAEMPDFIPQSEDYYPWALFVTDKDDLQEDYHHRAQQYLHGDNAGKKNYVVVTNGKELCVFDFKYEVAKYTVDFDKLLGGDKKESENWQAFLADFGVESAKGKKKQRRKDVTIYTEPKDERLSAVKRFGHQPEFKKPIGWDNKNFLEIFKTKNLPFLPTEEFDWDGTTQKITNRIVWITLPSCVPFPMNRLILSISTRRFSLGATTTVSSVMTTKHAPSVIFGMEACPLI